MLALLTKRTETNLLHKGLNFCPTPLPPRKEETKGNNDAFSRRLNLKEYHAPDDMEDIRVFKIEERGRLEERHGRRGPGSNIRCSRSSAAGKLS